MTYREYAKQIDGWTDDQKDSDMTVHDSNQDEFFPVTGLNVASVNDVLDEGHPFMEIDGC